MDHADKARIFKVLAILSGIFGSIYVLSPFLPTLLLAAVVAFAINPLVHKIKKSQWCGHYICLYVLTFGLFLLVTVPFLTAISKIYGKLLVMGHPDDGKENVLENFNEQKAHLIRVLDDFLSQIGLRKALDVDSIVTEIIHKLFDGILQLSTLAIAQIPDLLFSLAIFWVALFLFMRYSVWIEREFYSLELMSTQEIQKTETVLRETSYSAIFSSISTSLIQSVIVTGGAAILLDVDLAFVFIVTFISSFIPVIGAAPIAFALAIYAWIKESPGASLGMAIVGTIAGIADNIARIYLLKIAKDKLHPFWSLLAIIGGIIVFGLPGLFLGPVVVSATMQILPMLLKEEKRDNQ